MLGAERIVTFDEPLTPPKSLSPTSAATWQRCQLKYALSYLFGWQGPSTLPHLVGNTPPSRPGGGPRPERNQCAMVQIELDEDAIGKPGEVLRRLSPTEVRDTTYGC
jgi:hypothetical protein